SGAEAAAGAGEEHGPDGRVGRHPPEFINELARYVAGESYQEVGTVERDARDGVLLGDNEVFWHTLKLTTKERGSRSEDRGFEFHCKEKGERSEDRATGRPLAPRPRSQNLSSFRQNL